MYFVIALHAESSAIQKCEREIERCEWMDFETYLQHPNVHEMNRLFLRTFIANEAAGLRIDCRNYKHELLNREYQIYANHIE